MAGCSSLIQQQRTAVLSVGSPLHEGGTTESSILEVEYKNEEEDSKAWECPKHVMVDLKRNLSEKLYLTWGIKGIKETQYFQEKLR